MPEPSVCWMVVPVTPADQLFEARAICRRIPSVWFSVAYRIDPKTREQQAFYRIFRRGMGKVAERSTPGGLVAYLRKQLP